MSVRTKPIQPEAIKLLSHLHRGGNVAHFQASNPNDTYTDPKTGELKETKESHWFNVGDEPEIPTRWDGQHIFFCVNPGEIIIKTKKDGTKAQPLKTKQRIENVSAVNCLYAEFDADDYGNKADILKHISTLALQPTVSVDSSTNGLQCYWFLAETYVIGGDEIARACIQQLQYDWVEFVGGDKAAKDLARVLRLPGIPNYKAKYAPNYPLVSVRDADYSRVYALEEFERLTEHLRRARAERQPVESAHQIANISLDDQELWDVLFGKKKNGNAILNLYNGDLSNHHNDHSNADLALCNHLAWVTGKDAARIDRMFRQSALMRPKWERDDYRNWTINKAISGTGTTYDPNYRSSDDNWGGSGNLDDVLMGVQMVAHTQQKKKVVLDVVEVKRQAYEAAQAAYDDDDDDDDDEADDIPTSAPQPAQQAQGATPHATQSAPILSRSQKLKNLLSGNGWNFRLNVLDNAVEVNGQRLSDIDESLIITHVRDVVPKKHKVSKEEVRDVINVMAHENQYHPIREYLDSLVWDGKNHIGELARYFKDKHDEIIYEDGAKRSVFSAFSEKWLISVVAKIYETGTVGAQSPMLVLSGVQDLGKSTFVKWLASGRISYYNESDIKPDSEDHKRLLATKWIWEVGEVGATTRKADVESLKHFLTMSDVTFRVPYGRYHLRKPALASFVGTVNPDKVRQGFLSDNTGNRRFLTIELRSVNQAYEKELDPHQLWAQAVALYKQGASWRLDDVEKAMRDRINNGNMIKEPVSDWLFKYFDIDPTEDWEMPISDIVDMLHEKGVKDTTKSLQMAVSNVLISEGLRKNENARPRSWIGIKYK